MFKERTSVLDYFRKPVDPKELVRKWQAELRAETRKTERSIRGEKVSSCSNEHLSNKLVSNFEL